MSCFICLAGTKLSGDRISGTVTIEKSKSLDDSHQREYDTDSRGGTGADLSDKKGISHIVKGSHQHTDDRWYGQSDDKSGNGCVGQQLLKFFCFHENTSFLFGVAVFSWVC